MSSYSDPGQYKPHITMGYSKQRIPITRFQSNLKVSPDALEVSVEREGEYTVVHRSALVPSDPPPPTPNDPMPLTPIEEPVAAAKADEPVVIDEPVSLHELPLDQSPLMDELDAYEKFTLNRWGKPLRAFSFNVIDEAQQTQLLASVALCQTKSDVKHLFEGWRTTLKARDDEPDIVTPEQAQEWWGDYDRLMKTLGNDWLIRYMKEVWRRLESRLSRDISVDDVKTLLADFHPQLIEEWTGTAEEPGVIAKLFMAGMGAGQAAAWRLTNHPN